MSSFVLGIEQETMRLLKPPFVSAIFRRTADLHSGVFARLRDTVAYKIGQLKLIELRQRAEKSLGKKFDVRAFHDEVLRDGAVPLEVLEAKIDRWIAAQG